jgi:hypothetical protein
MTRYQFIRGAEICGRNPYAGTCRSAVDDLSFEGKSPPEQPARQTGLSRQQGLTNRRTRDTATAKLHLVNLPHRKSLLLAYLPKESETPFAAMTEGEIRANVYLLNLELFVQDLHGKITGGGLRELTCERYENHQLDAKTLEYCQLLLQGLDLTGRVIGGENLQGMGIEGDDCRDSSHVPGPVDKVAHELLMAEVYPVEVPDGCDGTGLSDRQLIREMGYFHLVIS